MNTNNEGAYRVITPLGPVVARFGDEFGVEFDGEQGAIGCILAVMAVATGSQGRSLTVGNLEPHDFVHFCQPEGSGIAIMEPVEDVVESLMFRNQAESTMPADAEAVLDSADQNEALASARDEFARAEGVMGRLAAASRVVDLIKARDEMSDDPTSPNYRFRDTGYVANSRKELAASLIRAARESGQRVVATDIDWQAIEENPRAAVEIITKSNLFGKTDWEGLRDSGMEPGAGFLIDRVYASIAPAPSENKAQSRKDYAVALQTIRDRLESCKTAEHVTKVLDEIRDELTGSQLNADETVAYEAARDGYRAVSSRRAELRKERELLSNALYQAQREVNQLKSEQVKRERRGWKPDPELGRQIDDLSPAVQLAEDAIKQWDEAHPENKEEYVTESTPDGGITGRLTGVLNDQMTAFKEQMRVIEKGARMRNLTESQLTRGWLTFGERFFSLINYRYNKGSSTFAGHVTNAKSGRIKDWSFAEKEQAEVKRATKQEIGFRLRVADNYERVGGRSVSIDSTFALKDMLGFRDIQSGNWVLKDPNSARFHVQQTAHAMLDMSDMLGIDAKSLGLDGRLAMAFGARGTGNAGFGGGAKAHYESVQRVINLTKMGGGGSLAHEWFHAIDDMLGELSSGESTGSRNFASEDASVLPDGPLRKAMQDVMSIIKSGGVRLPEVIKLKEKDKATAKYNIDRPRNDIARSIKAAGSVDAAVVAVDSHFLGREDARSLKLKKQWRTMAAAYYSEDGAIEVKARVGPEVSSFMAEAVILDGGVPGKYWSKPLELAARAFQSFIEDKLAEQSRRNDYLSSYADNKHHFDSFLGVQWNPYPDGDERIKLNAAFERLFEAIRKERVFERAAKNKALLDSIFGSDDEGDGLAD